MRIRYINILISILSIQIIYGNNIDCKKDILKLRSKNEATLYT